MTPEQWEELVEQVEVHGPENIRFILMPDGEYPRRELGEPNNIKSDGNTIDLEFI